MQEWRRWNTQTHRTCVGFGDSGLCAELCPDIYHYNRLALTLKTLNPYHFIGLVA